MLLLQVLSYPAGWSPSMTGAGFYSLTEIYSHHSITSKYLNECLDNYTQRCLNCCVYMPKREIEERNAQRSARHWASCPVSALGHCEGWVV